MKAYQLDRAGFLIGETEADESPLEPGVYLLPAGCVFAAEPPTDIPEGLWPRWNGSGWIMGHKPRALAPPDPVEKLKAFLENNPDVAALLLPNNGGADV